MEKICPNTLASDLLVFNADIASGQKFGRDTIHLFCSPLFVRTMQALFDKNIATTSCGSGKERGILPGITGDFNALSPANKAIAKDMLISPTEFRIGAPITPTTTFTEFETELLKIADLLQSQ